MAVQPDDCRLLVFDNYPARRIEIPMEDNWILFIMVNDVRSLNLYSDAANEIPVCFQSTADIPLKILIQVRNHLMSYSNKSSEDKAMDKFIFHIFSTVINLNYNIINRMSSDFQSIYNFYKWINRKIFEGVYPSIQKNCAVLVEVKMTSEQKTCRMFVYSLSENDSDVDLFTIEVLVPVDAWKSPLVVKYDKALAFCSGFSEGQDKDGIPIKVLNQIRDELISYNDADIPLTLEDMALDQSIDIINNLNYNIPINCNLFRSTNHFHKWINRILTREIRKSIGI